MALNLAWFATTCMPSIGCVLAWTLFLTMLPRIRHIYHTGSLQGFSPLPLSWIFPNALFSISYAVLLQDHYIFACNGVIVVLSLWYLMQLLAARDMTVTLRRQLHTILVINMVMWLAANYICLIMLSNGPIPNETAPQQRGPLMLSKDPATAYHIARLILGSCNTFTILCFYLAPLTQLWQVYKTHDTSSFVIPSVIVTFVNCLIWTTYGVYLDDAFIFGPSIMGAIVTSIQLTLCFWYTSQSIRLDVADMLPHRPLVERLQAPSISGGGGEQEDHAKRAPIPPAEAIPGGSEDVKLDAGGGEVRQASSLESILTDDEHTIKSSRLPSHSYCTGQAGHSA